MDNDRGRCWRWLDEKLYRDESMKQATETTIFGSGSRSLIGDLLWLTTSGSGSSLLAPWRRSKARTHTAVERPGGRVRSSGDDVRYRRQARARTRQTQPGRQQQAHADENGIAWWIAAALWSVKRVWGSSELVRCVHALVSSQERSLRRTSLRPQLAHTAVPREPHSVHRFAVQGRNSVSTSHLSKFKWLRS